MNLKEEGELCISGMATYRKHSLLTKPPNIAKKQKGKQE
jgi:hypothetical protein